MNKGIALLLIGVISLAMVLIMLNHGGNSEPQGALVGVQNPLPQTGMPTSSALQVPTTSAPPMGQTKATSNPAPIAAQSKVSANTPPAGTQATVPPAVATVQQPIPQPASSPQGGLNSNNSQVLSPTAPNVQEVAQNTRQAAERPVQAVAPASTVKEKPAPPVEKKPAPTPPKTTGPKTINKITVSAAGTGAKVRIAGNANLDYKTMHLKSPDRIVVDLEGVWGVKAPGVPSNKAVTNVRIGKQPDKTRIVIDLASPSATVNFIKVDDETLEVRIK